MRAKGSYVGMRGEGQEAPLAGQSRNNAGGYGWEVNQWERLNRFFIVGSTDGTYYVSAQLLTDQNIEVVKKCIVEDGERVLALIVKLRTENRTKKLDALLVGLALVMAFGSAEVKKLAYRSVPLVAITMRQTLQLLNYTRSYRGSSRGFRTAFANVVRDPLVKDLAYQIAKYGAADGWTVNDLLRLTQAHVHGTAEAEDRQAVFAYAKKGWTPEVARQFKPTRGALGIIAAKELVKAKATLLELGSEAEDTLDDICSMIGNYGLTHEMIPNSLYKYSKVWVALARRMPVQALIRNLGRLTSVGVIPTGETELKNLILEKLSLESLLPARIHPLMMYIALEAYKRGANRGGVINWSPDFFVARALVDGFLGLLKSELPTNKRFKVGIDVSGSMASTSVTGSEQIPVAEVAVALAWSLVQIESNVATMAFDTRAYEFQIGEDESLAAATQRMKKLINGGTDCSIPIIEATRTGEMVDVFLIITDSEHWYGKETPTAALVAYRRKVNPNAKLIVAAVASNGTSIGDPNDRGVMNIVGFDANVLQLIQDFALAD